MELIVTAITLGFTALAGIVVGFIRFYATTVQTALDHNTGSIRESQAAIDENTAATERNNVMIVKLEAEYRMHMWAAHNMQPRVLPDYPDPRYNVDNPDDA